MHIRKDQWPIVLVYVGLLMTFGGVFWSRQDYEFLLYIGVLVFFLLLFAGTNRKVAYPNRIAWGLTLWAFMHLCGGGLRVHGDVLYNLMLIDCSEKYSIFRYDQLVHIVGFGAATVLMHHLLRPLLRPELKDRAALSVVIVMAGLGVGAVNEIVEFVAVVMVPETNVGGYVNTAMDLVSDLIGALGALAWIWMKHWRLGDV